MCSWIYTLRTALIVISVRYWIDRALSEKRPHHSYSIQRMILLRLQAAMLNRRKTEIFILCVLFSYWICLFGMYARWMVGMCECVTVHFHVKLRWIEADDDTDG